MKRNLFSRSYKRKVEQNYQYIWTNNGQIYLRKSKTDQKIEINNEEDLNKIVKYCINLIFIYCKSS